jgi:hypothetical protein
LPILAGPQAIFDDGFASPTSAPDHGMIDAAGLIADDLNGVARASR